MPELKIGALARRTGTNAPTIRFYEAIALLPSAARGPGGQRTYTEDDVRQLMFIRRCRDFGFSVEQVRELVALTQARHRSCTNVREIAQHHLDTIQGRLTELRALERTVREFVRQCDEECPGGPACDCIPLGALRRGSTEVGLNSHQG